MAICKATWMSCYQDSFLMTHALVTCCKGSFAEIIQTFFESIMQKCDCVQALMM